MDTVADDPKAETQQDRVQHGVGGSEKQSDLPYQPRVETVAVRFQVNVHVISQQGGGDRPERDKHEGDGPVVLKGGSTMTFGPLFSRRFGIDDVLCRRWWVLLVLRNL